VRLMFEVPASTLGWKAMLAILPEPLANCAEACEIRLPSGMSFACVDGAAPKLAPGGYTHIKDLFRHLIQDKGCPCSLYSLEHLDTY
jgi:hypothetical protein